MHVYYPGLMLPSFSRFSLPSQQSIAGIAMIDMVTSRHSMPTMFCVAGAISYHLTLRHRNFLAVITSRGISSNKPTPHLPQFVMPITRTSLSMRNLMEDCILNLLHVIFVHPDKVSGESNELLTSSHLAGTSPLLCIVESKFEVMQFPLVQLHSRSNCYDLVNIHLINHPDEFILRGTFGVATILAAFLFVLFNIVVHSLVPRG